MPLQLLNAIRHRASQMAYSSSFYDWSLSGSAPERLIVRPQDCWAGDVERGRMIFDGVLSCHGETLPVGQVGWMPYGISDAWMKHVHGFSWLRDLRSLSCEKGMSADARRCARAMIQSWLSHYRSWDRDVWRPDIVGQRLSMWLSHYEFFGEFGGADDEADRFEALFFDAAIRQARHLSHVITQKNVSSQKPGRFNAAKGLLYAGISFEGHEVWIDQALSEIEAAIDDQIAGDGSHRSRSPQDLLDVLKVLLDVRMALQSADYPLPEKIQHAVDKMGPALRFFRYNDKGLALFNGTQENDRDDLDSVMRQCGIRGKAMSSLPCTGFERIVHGRTTLLMDVGKAGDHVAHHGPLSFEMNYGRQRVFVNCGTHPLDEQWGDALAACPAHTGLTLDNRNPLSGKAAYSSREDQKNTSLLEAAHEGYVALNGFTHKRRLYVSDQGHDIRGEDSLVATHDPQKPVDAVIRFHIHPKVMVSLIREGQEALLRLPGGVGWRFHHSGGRLVLEDSVYMGEGCQPRKTKQLAIYGQITQKQAQIQWAVQREG